MIQRFRSCLLTLLFLIAFSLLLFAESQAAENTFQVRFADSVHQQPFTGRVYLIFTRMDREPRLGPSWFQPELFIARDVKDWQPGDLLEFTPDLKGLLSFPTPLSEMKLSGYRAQAVVRFNDTAPQIGTAPGNGFSQVITVPAGGFQNPPLLTVDKLVPEKPVKETQWSKLFKVRSPLLSKFHGRDTYFEATVLLPQTYFEQPQRKYPVIYTIPGFGGDHLRGRSLTPVPEQNKGGVEFIRVLLNPQCRYGHHVFADSANNGPVGKAFTTEFLPALEITYRAIPHQRARFLTGHSSGGWSSLWLQVTYPETFGGTWSTAPDPVDFRDFQQINLYDSSSNMYRDAANQPRPLARMGQVPVLWYESFAKMEHVLGHGGQLRSFEAVFSPRGKDGTPLKLYDRETGTIDSQVVETWKAYDIRLILETNWKKLAPQLAGKIHVFMGDQDTFYLEGATVLLKQTLDRLNENIAADSVVEIFPGKNHSSLMTKDLVLRMRKEMVQSFLAHQAEIK
ncbi:alpha/beta hydrolase-fold protein [uncultured Gimesia sp.]|uniref:alpha/beta hydrolase-fold protein n=1 Tax=uncultured Gimesia sp. TaxID=1678688 RepID=UPI0030D7976D